MPDAVGTVADVEREVQRLRRRLSRERTARAEVELIAETKIRELYERQQELGVLERVASTVNAARSSGDAFQVAVTQICRFARWPVGHVLLYADGVVQSTAIWHLDDPELFAPFVDATLDLHRSPKLKLADVAVAQRAAVWVEDFSADERYVRHRSARETGLRAAAAAPVWVGDEIVGVFEFFGLRASPVDERLLSLIGQVGVQVGRAIEREQADAAQRDHHAELERLVAERTASLTVANRELASFAYSVSHDLRAPLRAIHGFSQALEEDYADQLDAGGVGYLARVRAATERMGELIDGMLLLAQVTRDELQRSEVDLSAIAEEVVAELRAGDPGRTVQVTIEDGVRAQGDKRMLRLVVQNLIGNAWKFTRRTTDAAIRFETVRDGDECVFVIADNGVGFDMQYASKLFGAFQRMHAAADFEGTGIGLATVQRIVLRHSGRIWAQATPGAGARFSFTLSGSEVAA